MPCTAAVNGTSCPAFSAAAVRLLAAALLLLALPAAAQVVELQPVADANLYSESPNGASGAGDSLFAGRTALGERRRALLRFDPAAALPEGAVVTGVELELSMTRTIVDAVPVGLHRALAAWGEGASVAPGQGGIAAPAQVGDATWQWRFFPDQAWSVAGGDFDALASAMSAVDAQDRYTWSSAALAADVQDWIDAPASNHGWVLVADEGLPAPTAKRFASREHADPALRPLLRVSYSAGTAPPGAPGPRMIPAAGSLALIALAVLLCAVAFPLVRNR